jgi:hypothetical protein
LSCGITPHSTHETIGRFDVINVTTQQHHSFVSLSKLYLAFVILSLLVSWGIFSEFLFSGDASMPAFFQQAFANPVSSLVSSDIVISALIFFVFAYRELKRLEMPPTWLAIYVMGTFSVGICFALSLFLYQRELWLKRFPAPA